MRKSQVLEHFKTQIAVAEALEISSAAVSKWPELIPELQAARLERLTEGKLQYDPDQYKKSSAA